MSGANYQPGQVLTAAELNSSLDSKTDNGAAAITGGQVVGLTLLQVAGNTNTTSPSTGVAVIAGGVGIALDVQVGGGVTTGGAIISNSTTDSTSTTSGALVVAGGVGVGKNLNVGGSASVGGSLTVTQAGVIQSTTDASSNTTGALTVAGGVGVAKKLYVGGIATFGLDLSIGGVLSVTGASNMTGLLTVANMNVGANGVVTLASGASIMFPDGTVQNSAGGNSEAAISTTGGTTIINATQNNSNIFKVSGVLTSNAILVFPAVAKSFVVYNNTTGAFSLTIQANGQAPSVVVPQAKAVSLFCDSTGAYAAGSTGSGIGFTSIITPGANVSLTAQQAGAYVVQKIAGTTTTLPKASTLQAGQGYLFKDAIGGSILALGNGGDTAELAMPYTCTVGDEFLLVSDGVSKYSVALWVNNVWVKVSGGIIFPDGSQQTTAQGNTNATTVSYTVGATDTVGSFAAGDTALRTAGFVSPFADLIYNGLVCTIGVHFTLNADGLHLNWLGDPFKADDQITVKTRFPYNPSTVYVPGMQGFATTVGQTFIAYPHVQGFAYLLNVGGWLRPGIDYTDDNTGFYLQGWSTDAATELSVFAMNPVTIANVLASSNPVIVGGGLTFLDGSVQGVAAPGKNRFINGSFNVSQRGGSGLYTNGAVGYQIDRWIAANNAGGQFNQTFGSITYNGIVRRALVQTVATAQSSFSAAQYWLGFQQRIEQANCYDMIGRKATLSFIFNTNVAGTYSVALYDAVGNNGYVATFTAVANVPQKVIVRFGTFPGTLGFSNVSNAMGLVVYIATLAGSNYQTSTLNQWQPGNPIVSSANTNWAATVGNFISMSEAQLEVGDNPNPVFETESYQVTLAKCQRYYYKDRIFLSSVLSSVGLPVALRTTVGGSAVSGGGAGFSIGDSGSTTQLIAQQTSGSGQTIIIDAEL